MFRSFLLRAPLCDFSRKHSVLILLHLEDFSRLMLGLKTADCRIGTGPWKVLKDGDTLTYGLLNQRTRLCCDRRVSVLVSNVTRFSCFEEAFREKRYSAVFSNCESLSAALKQTDREYPAEWLAEQKVKGDGSIVFYEIKVLEKLNEPVAQFTDIKTQ